VDRGSPQRMGFAKRLHWGPSCVSRCVARMRFAAPARAA
jgi:hypothetical protein